nr:miraculin-like isoform X3 [Ipomoea trifida]
MVQEGFKYYVVPLDLEEAGLGFNLFAIQNGCPKTVFLAEPYYWSCLIAFHPVNPDKAGVIREWADLNVEIFFDKYTAPCPEPNFWKIEGDPSRYDVNITTGGENGNLSSWFKIVKTQNGYKFMYCPSVVCDHCRAVCKDFGISEMDQSRLVLSDTPFEFTFRRPETLVNNDVATPDIASCPYPPAGVQTLHFTYASTTSNNSESKPSESAAPFPSFDHHQTTASSTWVTRRRRSCRRSRSYAVDLVILLKQSSKLGVGDIGGQITNPQVIRHRIGLRFRKDLIGGTMVEILNCKNDCSIFGCTKKNEMASTCINNSRRFKYGAQHSSSPPRAADKCNDDKQEDSNPKVLGTDAAESEFQLDRLEIMLFADELFSDGKQLPLILPTIRLPVTSTGEAAGCPGSSSRCCKFGAFIMVSAKFSSSPAHIVAIVLLISEIPCEQGNIEPQCKPFCQKTFGAKFDGAQCVEQVGLNPFCACSYTC